MILVSYVFIFGFTLFMQIQNVIKHVCDALHTNWKLSYQRRNISCTQQTQLYLMKLDIWAITWQLIKVKETKEQLSQAPNSQY